MSIQKSNKEYDIYESPVPKWFLSSFEEGMCPLCRGEKIEYNTHQNEFKCPHCFLKISRSVHDKNIAAVIKSKRDEINANFLSILKENITNFENKSKFQI